MSEKLCQDVPRARAQRYAGPALGNASWWLFLALNASACARTEPDRIAPDLSDRRYEAPAPRPRPPLEQYIPELTPLPPSVCDLGCGPPFTLSLERAAPWQPGAYYFRVSVDDAPAQVCSVVFEPVLGAAHDTCNEAGLPFRVSYRYDSSAQEITALSFLRVQRVVEVELLVAEDEPPLLELRHQLSWLPATGCAACASARPLSAQVAGPSGSTDAGVPPGDAGGLPADAGSSADAGGPADASSSADAASSSAAP